MESSNDWASLESEPWGDDEIVRRTNNLFEILKIKTRPIKAIQELKNSATSMFVAIFECLFSVQLRDIERRPRVVTDYIGNAQVVIAALSEVLNVGLSPPLSAEAVYHGDLQQIHHMLTIFEQLSQQLGLETRVRLDRPKSARRGGCRSESVPIMPESPVSSISANDSLHKQSAASSKFSPEKRSSKGTSKVRASTSKRKENNKTAHKENVVVTKGSFVLADGVENLRRASLDPNEYENIVQDAEQDSVKVLMEKYPSMYKALAKRGFRSSRESSSKRVSKFASRLEHDLSRYQKSYKILLKDLATEGRKHGTKVKGQADRALKAKKLQEKISHCKSIRVEKDMSNLGKSLLMQRQTKEEVLVHTLLEKSIKIQNEWFLAKKRMEDEELQQVDKDQMNRYLSMEKFYQDRESMLRETMEQQAREQEISNSSRRISMKQLETAMESEHESKMKKISQMWRQKEEHMLLAHEEEITQEFENMTNKFTQ